MKQRMLWLRSGLSLTAALLLLAGCGPTNADEFRKAVGGSSSSHVATTYEEFEVARPFQDVTATLRQKAEQCLDKTVHVICANCIGKRDMGQQTWTPTIIATDKRTEVHLQLKRTDIHEIGTPPKGIYEIVLDVTPLDKKRTKIEIYRLRPNKKFIHEAMKQWAKGNTAGCPDLTTTQ